jgi:hypothetical protein
LRHRWHHLSSQRGHAEVIVEQFGYVSHCATYRIIPGGMSRPSGTAKTEASPGSTIFRPRHSMQDFEGSPVAGVAAA